MKNKLFWTNSNITWQWDNNPVSILNAMKWWSKDRKVALSKLKEGQANNEDMQSLYDWAAEKLANFEDLVFYSTASKADFSELQSHLEWQWQNNWNSLLKSEKAWNEHPKQEIWAYYHLLWGQRNHPKILNLYRACWSENKETVMFMVSKICRK